MVPLCWLIFIILKEVGPRITSAYKPHQTVYLLYIIVMNIVVIQQNPKQKLHPLNYLHILTVNKVCTKKCKQTTSVCIQIFVCPSVSYYNVHTFLNMHASESKLTTQCINIVCEWWMVCLSSLRYMDCRPSFFLFCFALCFCICYFVSGFFCFFFFVFVFARKM